MQPNKHERTYVNTEFTEIIAILDRSGSMRSIVNDTIGGFNTFVDEQRKSPGLARLTLVQFDHEFQEVYAGKPLSEVPPLSLLPRGNTALYDAIGRAIQTTGERLASMPEAERPGKVLVVILTDGEENASSEFRAENIAEMIRHQQEVYSWGFIFLGANQDAILTAQAIGIAADSSITYGANSKGVNSVLRSASVVATSYRGTGQAVFSAEQRKGAMGDR